MCDEEHGGKNCLLCLIKMEPSYSGLVPQREVVKLWGGSVAVDDPVRIAACPVTANSDDEYNQRYWAVTNGPGEERLVGLFGRCIGTHIELPPGVCAVTYRLTGLSWGRLDAPNGWDGNCDGKGCTILESACGGATGTTLKTSESYCAYHVYTEPGWTCEAN